MESSGKSGKVKHRRVLESRGEVTTTYNRNLRERLVEEVSGQERLVCEGFVVEWLSIT